MIDINTLLLRNLKEFRYAFYKRHNAYINDCILQQFLESGIAQPDFKLAWMDEDA